MKDGCNRKKIRIFSDEKLFVCDRVLHKQNDRYLTADPVATISQDIRCNPINKAPKKVMVLGVVASNGLKCPMVFIDEGERVTAQVYIRLLKQHVIPWIRKNYKPGTYIFQQDGARAHTARATLSFLAEESIEFLATGHVAAKFAGSKPSRLRVLAANDEAGQWQELRRRWGIEDRHQQELEEPEETVRAEGHHPFSCARGSSSRGRRSLCWLAYDAYKH